MGDKPRVYFKGLNGLRFFAAFAVIIAHLELTKKRLAFCNLEHEPIFKELGSLGVYFFFVLSGFLITYLLLAEKREINKIALKEFYLRRILRIWPLYFLIVAIGFFVLPLFDFFTMNSGWKVRWNSDMIGCFILYMAILPNLATAVYTLIPHIGQAWSIGVEEQFYIIWPIMMKSRKLSPIFLLVAFIIVWLAIKIFCLIMLKLNSDSGGWEAFAEFLAMSKMENMAIGGIGAVALHDNWKYVLSLIYNPVIFISSIIISLTLMYYTPEIVQNGIHMVYAVLYLIIIINVAAKPRKTNILESKVFNYLGKISYGLYMYHLISVFIVVKVLGLFFGFDYESFFQNMMLYALSLGLTVIMSDISYRFLEKYFIKKKSKFSKILSGENALN